MCWYTNFLKIKLVADKIRISHGIENERFYTLQWFDFIRDSSILEKTGIPLREQYGKIFSDVFVGLASVEYVLYVSLQSFMICGQSVKEKLLSFISYCVIFSITPQSLAPKFSRSPITLSPIPCYPITSSATITTQSLFSNDHLLPDRLIAPTHLVPSLLMSNLLPDFLIALPFIFEKTSPRKVHDSNISGSHQKDTSYNRRAGSCAWRVLQKRRLHNIEIYLVNEKVGRGGSLEKTLRSPIALASVNFFRRLLGPITIGRVPTSCPLCSPQLCRASSSRKKFWVRISLC